MKRNGRGKKPLARIAYGTPHSRSRKQRLKEMERTIDEAMEKYDRQEREEETAPEPPTEQQQFSYEQITKLLVVLRDLDPALREAALSNPRYALAMLDQIARGEEPCLGLLQGDENLEED